MQEFDTPPKDEYHKDLVNALFDKTESLSHRELINGVEMLRYNNVEIVETGGDTERETVSKKRTVIDACAGKTIKFTRTGVKKETKEFKFKAKRTRQRGQ